MKNPYFELHKEFKAAGANVLMSSGQACVLFGIATFSKDGDWIIEESKDSCTRVLKVLEEKNAFYRLGAPLDLYWLSKGWTSHFEYFLEDSFRMRVDFCSRPPRVENLKALWENAGKKHNIDVVDIQSLVELKQTRRVRDYNIVGVLAEVLGFNENRAVFALTYLQDYDLLKKAVEKWPEDAKKSAREVVRLIIQGKPRRDIIIALAIEQDEKILADEQRISYYREKSKTYQKKFVLLSKKWRKQNSLLSEQHRELISLAEKMLQ